MTSVITVWMMWHVCWHATVSSSICVSSSFIVHPCIIVVCPCLVVWQLLFAMSSLVTWPLLLRWKKNRGRTGTLLTSITVNHSNDICHCHQIRWSARSLPSVIVTCLVVAWHCCHHCSGGWWQLNGDCGCQEVVVGGSSGDKAQVATAMVVVEKEAICLLMIHMWCFWQPPLY